MSCVRAQINNSASKVTLLVINQKLVKSPNAFAGIRNAQIKQIAFAVCVMSTRVYSRSGMNRKKLLKRTQRMP